MQGTPDTQGKQVKQLTARQQSWQMVKFTLFSASAGAIQIGTFALFNEVFHLPEALGYVLSLVLSVLWNFTFNRKLTFRSVENVPKAMLLVGAYYLVFTPLSTWWLSALIQAGWNKYIVEIGTMLINFVTEYLYQRFVVYRYTIDTNALARRQAEKEARGAEG